MTVCIAATCDNGQQLVTATDGLLSMGDVTEDSLAGKMLWLGEWQFLYAGTPANFAMVTEEMDNIILGNPEAASRRHIQETVRRAFRKACARLASCDSLNPFDMTIDEFKDTGLNVFGQSFHDELLRQISQKGSLIEDQIIVAGWGHTPHSIMIYEVGRMGEWEHHMAGFAAIGSGAQVAQNMLLLLRQARHKTLAETIFNVACAKFASEKSGGLDVGQMTIMHVSQKPANNADVETGKFVSFEDIDRLRALWDAHLRPRIPDEARLEIMQIAARLNESKISVPDMLEYIQALERSNAKCASSEGLLNPESTTGEKSPQPSQE